MTGTLQHQDPPASGRVIPLHSGQPADVIDLIMADHRRIRYLRDVLDDSVRSGSAYVSAWILARAWQRQAELLEAHMRAEEEICYRRMSGSGPHQGEWRREAVADHDGIREALGEAARQPVGSALWWGAAGNVLAVSCAHFDCEEAAMVADSLPRLTMSRRLELGHRWLEFVTAWNRRPSAERQG